MDDINIKNKIKSIKLVIKSTYGGNKTYINQIMLFENTAQEINNNNNNESILNSNNTYQQEINLPEDLSNSQITEEEKKNKKRE